MNTKKAEEVKVDDVVCERSGFMWKVTKVRHTKCYCYLNLTPVHRTIIGEEDHTLGVKKTTLMRMA